MQKKRRTFIKQLGCVGIGFSIAPTLLFAENNAADNICGAIIANDDAINAWLKVLENGKIEIFTGKMELGQGIRIAVAQVAAEELNTDPENISVNLAETGITPDEGYTAGSNSIVSSAMAVRKAAASAREVLLTLAAEKLSTEKSSLSLENGHVIQGTQKVSFSTILNGKQFNQKLDPEVKIQAKKTNKWVGKPVPRKDISAMVTGQHTYVQDLRFPNMVHARILRPKAYNAALNALDANFVTSAEGFLKLVRIGSFVGVIAEEEYQAIKMREQLNRRAKWDIKETLPTKTNLKNYIKNLPTDSKTDENKGNSAEIIDKSGIKHSAAYSKPYVMHAANGPSCAVAFYQDDKLEIWSHTQGVYPLRKTLSTLLELPEINIHVKGIPGSGCYGHNGADDVAAEAALLALEYPGKHVRLQWMRDDEHGWEPYGTAMLMELKAGLAKDGTIEGWQYDLWSDAHSTRPGGNPENLLPARYLDRGYGAAEGGFRGGAIRNALPYYDLPNIKNNSHIFRGPLRTSALRGLGAYANIFAIECFMDELAEKSSIDPVVFRLNHLSDVRAKDCLSRLRENTQKPELAENEGLGFAFSRYKNSAAYCSVAAHVHVNSKTGSVQVKKMWAVIDAGETINPDGLKNQTEGGMIQSASWALKEKVLFDENHITSLDWETYPIFRFPDIPEVEVEIIDRPEEPPLGAGEAAQGPATAAVINAIWDATGIRIRDLPVKKEDLVRV
ncbi:xanthine dehydrogenase family protein molybdopterin-binding subunit [Flavimarina sp. Hel_I_48]|uniref:xanthine dehydrogenase family protein molybdopterin-binding subunit n=1 Tax=Flavimarina sp. Hel_I_48 TaxID=1392488 RepID=UPI0004DEE9BF|nr:molybdopterin cofactor-binding domain-containing protein [Flavimarina sp. Hel_I_48]